MAVIQFELLKVGYCNHPECIVRRGGKWENAKFPALCALISHSHHGLMLYDTGYSNHFSSETKGFPECIYSTVTPVKLPPEEQLIDQLAQRNIKPADIRTIIVSHFHADHVAGLQGFPQARFISFASDYLHLTRKNKFAQIKNGYLHGLVPDNFLERNADVETLPKVPLPPQLLPFDYGYDLFGDQSIIGINLPGHAQSQLGIFLEEQQLLMVADAVWSIEALSMNAKPAWLAYNIFANNKQYNHTFDQLVALHQREKEIKIIPSHCLTTWKNERIR